MLSEAGAVTRVGFDCSELATWDTRLLSLIRAIALRCDEAGIDASIDALPDAARQLLRLSLAVPPIRDTGRGAGGHHWVFRTGVTVLAAVEAFAAATAFVGEVSHGVYRLLRGRARFRLRDLAVHIEEASVNALGIVTLINFLVGVILAFVGSVQLVNFGAAIYVANLVGIAMVRAMSAMMTAIIMTGRTGAAYAAQLGTMTVNEEVDALQTMGISPLDSLVLPRVIALSVMMPLLVLYADFVGIIGGAVVGVSMLNLSFTQYFEQTRRALDVGDFAVGLISASVYGVLVALTGCYAGLRSGRSAQAVGRATTSAVVSGLVLIIAATAILTVIFTVLGV